MIKLSLSSARLISFSIVELLACFYCLSPFSVMLIMATFTSRSMKRSYPDYSNDPLILSTIDSISSTISCSQDYRDYHTQCQCSLRRKRYSCDWSLPHSKKIKVTSEKKTTDQEKEQQYHCQVYLRLFPPTSKCSIDVVVKPVKSSIDESAEQNSILIGKSRLAKTIRAGMFRIRLVSSLFTADLDVSEDPSLTKYDRIQNQTVFNHFDKQFALVLKNHQIGPGALGKLFIESLDPSNGTYTNNAPIFELNLNVASEHEILLTSSHQISQVELTASPLPCGCRLSHNTEDIIISDHCNLSLTDPKLAHRLSAPLRCQWKSIGRQLFPCFSETDITDLYQTYFNSDGNHECTYQLLREWAIRDPQQANTHYLLTRLKLPADIISMIHTEISKMSSSKSN